MLHKNENQTPEAGSPRVLKLTIEGKLYEWHHQYITGVQIKQLANIALDLEVYLSIEEPWKDELIPNDKEVDLARPEIEHFYVKQSLKYTIEGKEFESNKQYIQGSMIRKQGQIPDGYEIFLSIKGPWEDEKISDDIWVDLARPGIENFYGCKPNTNNG